MKLSNAPARKLTRQIYAKMRAEGGIRIFNQTEENKLEFARTVRTKKPNGPNDNPSPARRARKSKRALI